MRRTLSTFALLLLSLSLALVLLQPRTLSAQAATTTVRELCLNGRVQLVKFDASGRPVEGECDRDHSCCTLAGGMILVDMFSLLKRAANHSVEIPLLRDISDIRLRLLSAKPRGPPLSEDWKIEQIGRLS